MIHSNVLMSTFPSYLVENNIIPFFYQFMRNLLVKNRSTKLALVSSFQESLFKFLIRERRINLKKVKVLIYPQDSLKRISVQEIVGS